MDGKDKSESKSQDTDSGFIPLMKLDDGREVTQEPNATTFDSGIPGKVIHIEEDEKLKLIPLGSDEQSGEPKQVPDHDSSVLPEGETGSLHEESDEGQLKLIPLETVEETSSEKSEDQGMPGMWGEGDWPDTDDELQDRGYLGYAGFGLRYVAFLFDWAIVILFCGFIFKIMNLSNAFVCIFFTMILSWLYFALMESSVLKATVGKLLFDIRVTDMSENRISFILASTRFWAKFLSGFMGIGFIIIGLTEKRQGLHDILSNCLVLERKPDNSSPDWEEGDTLHITNGSIRIISGCILASIPVFSMTLSILISSLKIDVLAAVIITFCFGIPGIFLIKWGLPVRKKHRVELYRRSLPIE